MRARRPVVVAMAAALLGSGCVTHVGGPLILSQSQSQRGAEYGYAIQRDVVYTPEGWPQPQQADLWLPRGVGPFVAVVVAHGGGWERGERSDMDGIAAQLARRGFAAIVVSYRLSPAYRFPAALNDLQQAVRWVRANAALYRFDPQRVGGYGYSAGGQLVSLLGEIRDGDPLDQPYGGPETRLQAVVAGATPFDFTRYQESPLIDQYLGATLEENPALHVLASPLTHVGPATSPMFIYQGSWDAVVPVELSRAMKAALDAAQVPSELYVVNGEGHFTLFLLNSKAVTAAVDFLDRRLR
jgi:acetyl esterase/lipase